MARLTTRIERRHASAALLAAGLSLALALQLAARATAEEGMATADTAGAVFDVDYDPFDSAPSTIEIVGSDPFDAQPANYDPFDVAPYVLPAAAPVAAVPAPPKPMSRRSAAALFDATARRPAAATSTSMPMSTSRSTSISGPNAPARPLNRLVIHQPEPRPLQQPVAEETLPDPCFVEAGKRPTDLTINIAMPSGEFPKNFAAACWEQIDAQAGPFAGARLWPAFNYQWNATAFCHHPLYFEEVNLERYGYGCCSCLQPAVSAAHFFGTVPALPYCMVANCPSECIYTLGYYRPGSCPPWQNNYPPCIGVR